MSGFGREKGSLEMNSFDLKEFMTTIRIGERNKAARMARMIVSIR